MMLGSSYDSFQRAWTMLCNGVELMVNGAREFYTSMSGLINRRHVIRYGSSRAVSTYDLPRNTITGAAAVAWLCVRQLCDPTPKE